MSTFDDRGRAFEAKFAHDAEMQFRAEARRNRLVAVWAAELLGKDSDEIYPYVREVLRADFQEAGDEDVKRKLASDLNGIVKEADILEKINECMALAKEQLLSEAT